jgi:hypothetical protein
MRRNVSDPGRVAFDWAGFDAKIFFWITSLNRVPTTRIAIGIARIARQPIRTRIASRDHRVARSA